MPLRRVMKSQPTEMLVAKGLLYQDWEALTPCQRECAIRLCKTVQLEQEAYLTQHPEISVMIQLFMARMVNLMKRKSDVLKETGDFFTRPIEEIDAEIRKHLELPPEGPYVKADKQSFKYEDKYLERDLREITMKYFPPPPWKIPTPIVPTPDTLSSSFISLGTSETTLPTPEPVPTPEPTMSQNMFALVSNAVDKAVYTQVDKQALLYDTAYVELMKAREAAMEIPVVEIKEDIADLFYEAYKMFEIDITHKEREAAAIAWEKRMRKKMKRSLRRANNFRGYETPEPSTSEGSSLESDRRPPPRPCVCHPQFHYNRYAKDRFGIYLPIHELQTYDGANVTVTPAISMESVIDMDGDEAEKKSVISRYSGKSVVSNKSSAPYKF